MKPKESSAAFTEYLSNLDESGTYGGDNRQQAETILEKNQKHCLVVDIDDDVTLV